MKPYRIIGVTRTIRSVSILDMLDATVLQSLPTSHPYNGSEESVLGSVLSLKQKGKDHLGRRDPLIKITLRSGDIK